MKKTIIFSAIIMLQSCLISHVNGQSSKVTEISKQALTEKALEGKWYPSYYTYYTDPDTQKTVSYKDTCTEKSYIEFHRKNSTNQFITVYATGKNCDQFSTTEGKYNIIESSRSITMHYGRGLKTTSPYKLVDENTLILYRETIKDGKEEKIEEYYIKK